MLLIDDAEYKLFTPKDEEHEFHPMIKEHSKKIFGEDSYYFDLKRLIKTSSGIGSIPDAYVITLNPAKLYVVENELSTHSIYDHVIKQLTKFINGFKNQETKNEIINILYNAINSDDVLKATFKRSSGTDELHLFLSRLLSKPPTIVIVIDEIIPELDEAIQVLNSETCVVEFKTYVRVGAESIKAHLFEPIREITGSSRILAPDKKEHKITEKQKMQFEFWRSFKTFLNENKSSINPSKVYPKHWCDIAIGTPKGFLSLGIDTRHDVISASFYAPSDADKKIFNYLLNKKQEIESEMGTQLTWYKLPDKKASRIKIEKKLNISDRDSWINGFQFLKEQGENIQRVFPKYLRDL